MKKENKQMHFLSTGFLISILIALSACASVDSDKQNMQQKIPVQVTNNCAALNYYEVLTDMSKNELLLQERMLRENLSQNASSCYQLRLVLLLMLPEAGEKDDKEAEEILKAIQQKEASLLPQDRQLAKLLADQIQWREEIRSGRESLRKKLKNERAASLNLLERLAEAQSKLKQLKKIDKNINEKEQEISAPSTDKIPHDPK